VNAATAVFGARVLVSNLKAALLAASTDETREHLNSVLVEFHAPTGSCKLGKARFVATNGHWIWFHEVNADVTRDATMLLSCDDVKRLIKWIAIPKGRRATEVEVELSTNGLVRQGPMELRIVPRSDECRFPPYHQILPSLVNVTERACTSVDGAYLSVVAQAFALVTLSKKATPVTLYPGSSELDPVIVTSDYVPDGLAIVMPMRVDRLNPGPLLERYRAIAAVEIGEAAQ
jgi:DNA polymerase III sliding clamp (beta) subunit (PCNA family)